MRLWEGPSLQGRTWVSSSLQPHPRTRHSPCLGIHSWSRGWRTEHRASPDNLADVGGDEVQDELLHVAVDSRPSSTAAHRWRQSCRLRVPSPPLTWPRLCQSPWQCRSLLSSGLGHRSPRLLSEGQVRGFTPEELPDTCLTPLPQPVTKVRACPRKQTAEWNQR